MSTSNTEIVAKVFTLFVFHACICCSIGDNLTIAVRSQERETSEAQSDIPVIVWWTGRLFPHFNKEKQIISCKTGSCLSTTQRRLQNDKRTRAFIFYGTDIEIENMPLPRQLHHEWALLHEESPMNNYFFSHTAGIQLFNYTGTFKRGSDYSLTTQFIPSLNYLTERKPVSLSIKNRLRGEGFASVLYIQSHCHVASDRDRYVSELLKYIEIDCYGACLHNKDLPSGLESTEKYNDKEFLDFISNYKFHIAFENAICEDYVTEKLFRAFHVGSVPIYKGSPSVTDWVPDKNSVIMADHFESPHSLAEFIKQVDNDDEMYESYLKFKGIPGITNTKLINTLSEREWGVNDYKKIDFITGFECFICNKIVERLNNEREHQKDNTIPLIPPKSSNREHMGCPQPHISVGSDTGIPQTDLWIQQSWVDTYWYAYDLARALQEIIKLGKNSSENIHEIALSMRYQH